MKNQTAFYMSLSFSFNIYYTSANVSCIIIVFDVTGSNRRGVIYETRDIIKYIIYTSSNIF